MKKTVTIFDTETTGFPSNKELEHQPYMVQIAAIQFVGDRAVRHHSAIIDNPNIEIPERTVEFHNITTEFAEENGIALKTSLKPFVGMAKSSSVILAFNTAFDLKILTSAMRRAFENDWSPAELTAKPRCVMNSCIEVVKKPGRFGKGFARPKQIEAYKHFFGEEATYNEHDAMDDVRACSEIYFELVNRGCPILAPVGK